MPTTREFASRLDELMELNGLTNSELARLIGVTPSAVSQWRADDEATLPRQAKVWRLESLFRLDHGSLWRLVNNDRLSRKNGGDGDDSTTRPTPKDVQTTATGRARTSESATTTHTPASTAGKLAPALVTLDDFDADSIVFQASTAMTEALASMKAKMAQVEKLRAEARDFFDQAQTLGQLAPGREDEIRALSRKAGEHLAKMDNLMSEVEELRSSMDARRQLMSYVVQSTRHIIGQDGLDPEQAQQIKAKDVVRRYRNNAIERQRALLNREYDLAENTMLEWFTTDERPNVKPLLSLLLTMVNRMNKLERQVIDLKNASSLASTPPTA